MPRTIRAKVTVGSFSESKPTAQPGGYESIGMHAVKSGGDDPEDNAYAEATPSCAISMTVSNPACFGFFEQGKKYYVDFTPVDE